MDHDDYDTTDSDTDYDYDEPSEGDLITYDHVKFYQYGKGVLIARPCNHSRSCDCLNRQIRRYMRESKWYPNVWFISDHGNAILMDTSPPKKGAHATP